MAYLFEKEIPKRLYADTVFANYITLNMKERFVLLLTKDLKVYEIKKGEIVHGIDLSDSILKGSLLPTINIQQKQDAFSSKQNSCPSNKVDVQDSKNMDSSDSSYALGKYILRKGSIKKIFILLKVLTKLVILERSLQGYKVIQEYGNVEGFEIVDEEKNFQPLVAIQFIDKAFNITTDFEENSSKENENDKSAYLENEESYKNLMERIMNAKTELSIHKIRTKKEFLEIKNCLMFGPNIIRGNKLEEKQPLGKYGDVWMRVVNDHLVIGIPIINNCSEKLISLQNIRIAIICRERDEINFDYNLYQLNDDSYKFDNFDELLQNNENLNRKLNFNDEWLPVKTRTLHPETSGVIVLKTKLENFICSTSYTDYMCFILYDVTFKHYTFTQQHFLKKIHIETDIMYKEDYQIKMDLSANSYMDLLAITVTSCFANLHIEYNDLDNDFVAEFKEFLSTKLDFKHSTQNKNESDQIFMDIDFDPDPFELSSSNFGKAISNTNDHNEDSKCEILYNDNKIFNYWYGSLCRLKVHNKNSVNLKLYFRSKDKIFTFAKVLYENLNCKFKLFPVCYSGEQSFKNLRYLENCFKEELDLVAKFCRESGKGKMKRSEVFDFQKQLFAKELETDLASINLNEL